MDAATQVQITGLLFTLVLPVGAAGLLLFAGRRLRPGATRLTTGLAVTAGLAVAALGINGAPSSPLHAADWLLIGPVVGGLLMVQLDGLGDRLGRLRPWIGGALALALLGVFGWRIAGALASAFTDGYAAPLAGSLWVIDALAVAAAVWIALQRALPEAGDSEGPDPTPILLGTLALALIGAAAATALTGSALVGQMIGGFAAVTGLVGLIGWRWPGLAHVGEGALGAAALAVSLALLHGHLFVEVPRPVSVLLMLAPLGGVVGVAAGRSLGRTLPAVGIALGVTAALVGAAAGLTGLNEQAKAAAVEAGSGDDDGTYYPY